MMKYTIKTIIIAARFSLSRGENNPDEQFEDRTRW
jgi:hypothetical protein